VTRRFALLVNPTAARGKALARVPAVTAEFDRLGAPHRVVQTRSIDHAREEALAAAAAGETVAALGGDGFLRPIAGVLAGGDGALAVLPGGRGNDFGRSLGIPSDPADAARVAVEGAESSLDIADVNGEPYIGIASLGFDSECNRIANETKLIRGNLVYLYSALRALASWKPAAFTVDVDGEHHEFSGWSVAVANSKAFGGGMFLAPHAQLDDGILEVVTISESSRWAYVRDLPKVFKGTHLENPAVGTLRGERVTVSADRPFDVYADGDPVATLPATMTVRTRALRVIVPAPPR
jgi:YegS/Rv2252/BmrU family lipid kinase